MFKKLRAFSTILQQRFQAIKKFKYRNNIIHIRKCGENVLYIYHFIALQDKEGHIYTWPFLSHSLQSNLQLRRFKNSRFRIWLDFPFHLIPIQFVQKTFKLLSLRRNTAHSANILLNNSAVVLLFLDQLTLMGAKFHKVCCKLCSLKGIELFLEGRGSAEREKQTNKTGRT